ncbi:hypothetical protein EMCRGX_G027492 [Ephydatia muelleri]
MATDTQTGLSIRDGALYLVQERLDTFKPLWPFKAGNCAPLKMAEAGFYYCGSTDTPDWVRCCVCHHELDGWDESDDPVEQHRNHEPDCPFLSIKDPYNITVADVIELERKAMEIYIQLESDRLTELCTAEAHAMRQMLTDVQQKHKAC